MVKLQFSAMDVTAQVAELRSKLVGLRLQNVYDISPKTYLFKLSKPDHPKEVLLIESGKRIHTTEFTRDKGEHPSNFAMKLRKHIRTKRLVDIQQIGTDRIIDLTFGEGEFAFHVIVEFYAAGNLILTDHEYKIMTLLRVVSLDVPKTVEDPAPAAKIAKGAQVKIDQDLTKFAVGCIYPKELARTFERISKEKIVTLLTDELTEVIKPTIVSSHQQKKKTSSKKDNNATTQRTLKKLLRSCFSADYGPTLCDHCLAISGLDPTMKVGSNILSDKNAMDNLVEKLVKVFSEADEILLGFQQTISKGYIITKEFDFKVPASSSTAVPTASTDLELPSSSEELTANYAEFQPYLFAQYQNIPNQSAIPFPTFNAALDEYFSKIESQKNVLKSQQAQAQASKKLASVKSGHETQIAGLARLYELSIESAQAIEENLDVVDEVIKTLRGFIASGIDWIDLDNLIKEEQRKKNPLALMIVKLKLDVGAVQILLPKNKFEDQDDSDSESCPSDEEEKDDDDHIKVDIDLYESAYANASRYYDSKKTAALKQEKTAAAAESILKTAERKIMNNLAQQLNTGTAGSGVAAIVKTRKPYWFEKFLWFISSQNYLVVGGRDATQNELLVKKHLRKGDVYVHADLHGAASVIVKNPYGLSPNDDEKNELFPMMDEYGNYPIPNETLHQAGTMSVCQSKAWDAKIITSAWYVYHDQVSKQAPTGEYLTTGSFMIRGKKNWLPPVQLIYGYGIIFKLDESCIARHVLDRRPWARGGIENKQDKEEKVEENEEIEQEPIENDGGPSKEDSGSSSDDDDFEFPDTVVQTTLPQSKTDVLSLLSNNDKYNLEEINDKDDDDDDSIPAGLMLKSSQLESKKRVTAKERRDAKKSSSADVIPKIRSSSSVASVPAPVVAHVRGKKGKQKKIKEKYGEQDEEDRKIMLEILGSNKSAQPKGKKAKAAAKADAKRKAAAVQHKQKLEKEEKRKLVEASSTHIYDEEGEIVIEGEDGEAAKQEIKQLLEEENVVLVDETQAELLSYLDSLTGVPHVDDVLLNAIPVCAPWSALQKFKYKVKLTPGGLKKGKAARSAINILSGQNKIEMPKKHTRRNNESELKTDEAFQEQDEEEILLQKRKVLEAREKELIKIIPEHELILQILGKVKISAVGTDLKKKK